MSKKQPLVGFDRYVEIAWMDQAALLVADGKSLSEINVSLDNYLMPCIDGETSRRKTKNILTATWAKWGDEQARFKKQSIVLYAEDLNKDERLAIHYGLCVAAYPYFLSLSKILGRLFKLQDEITNAEFYRRVVETVGDRDSIKRAAARYLQSLIEWGILEQSGKATVKSSTKIKLSNTKLVTWLYASVLFTCDKDRLSINDITSDPVWFPFEIPHGYFNLSESQLIEVVHQGVGSTLVALKK